MYATGQMKSVLQQKFLEDVGLFATAVKSVGNKVRDINLLLFQYSVIVLLHFPELCN